MGRINKLEENVFNMLAAGEVVERPASVVKELVENAIDAGATSVDILISDGGTRCIQVSDNGFGILKEDLRSAFLPHATSKIKIIEDLDTVATLGFRGEALSSIASVSEITLVSSAAKDQIASKIELSGGKVVFEGSASRTQGTTITVNNLFFNTPARLKFLKKPASEERYVTDAVRNIALSNPAIKITLANDNEILLNSEGGTLLEVICAVYDVETADKLYEVNFVSKYGITVKGYISSIDFSKSNRSFQTVNVNGRTVSDQTITTAVEKAYSEYLMKRNFPLFILDIIIPFDEVDVNVSPSKTEVRFRDKQAIFSSIYRAVQDSIVKNTYVNGYKRPTDGEILESLKSTNENPVPQNNTFANEKYFQTRLDTEALYSESNESSAASYGTRFGYNPSQYGAPGSIAGDKQTSYYKKDTAKSDYDAFSNEQSSNESYFTHSSDSLQTRVFDGKILGQAFDTYILAERDNKLYIIDQHAAHERILYDDIVTKFDVKYKQSLLIPYKFKLNAEETEYFESIMPALNDCGFEIEFKFGNYLMSAMPQPLVSMDFRKFLSNLLTDRVSADEFKLTDLLKESLCRTACRAAIKGGDSLSSKQIEYVIKNLSDKDGNLPRSCPHGRPAVIELTKTDLEKLFKRIV